MDERKDFQVKSAIESSLWVEKGENSLGLSSVQNLDTR